MSKIAIISLLMASGGGLLAAYIDFYNDEPQASMLVILLCAFLAGILSPKWAGLCAATIAAAFTLLHWIAPQLGIQPLYPMEGGPWWSLFVLVIPATVSAYVGVGARRLLAFN